MEYCSGRELYQTIAEKTRLQEDEACKYY